MIFLNRDVNWLTSQKDDTVDHEPRCANQRLIELGFRVANPMGTKRIDASIYSYPVGFYLVEETLHDDRLILGCQPDVNQLTSG